MTPKDCTSQRSREDEIDGYQTDQHDLARLPASNSSEIRTSIPTAAASTIHHAIGDTADDMTEGFTPRTLSWQARDQEMDGLSRYKEAIATINALLNNPLGSGQNDGTAKNTAGELMHMMGSGEGRTNETGRITATKHDSNTLTRPSSPVDPSEISPPDYWGQALRIAREAEARCEAYLQGRKREREREREWEWEREREKEREKESEKDRERQREEWERRREEWEKRREEREKEWERDMPATLDDAGPEAVVGGSQRRRRRRKRGHKQTSPEDNSEIG